MLVELELGLILGLVIAAIIYSFKSESYEERIESLKDRFIKYREKTETEIESLKNKNILLEIKLEIESSKDSRK